MELTGHIENGCLMLSQTQLVLRRNWLKNLTDGTLISEELSVCRKPKTWKQVKTHFGLVISMILETFSDNGWDSSILLNLPNPTGVEVTKGMLQEYLYAACPVHNEAGERVTLSKMNTVEESKFFEMVRNFSASQWGCYIPDPDPNWKQNLKDGV